MRTIKELTKQQEQQIPKFIDKFIKLAEKPTDRKKATLAVQNLYKNAGYKKPIVIFGQSPLSTITMVAMSKLLFKNNLIKKDSQLYNQLHNQLHNQLDSQLDNQLDNQLRSQLHNQLYNQLDSQLYNQLHNQLDSQLYNQLRSQLDSQLDNQLRSQLRSQLYNQLYSQLYNQHDNQLYSQLYNQLGSQLRSLNKDWWLITWWLVWAGWYSFGQHIGVKFDNKILKIFIDFTTNVNFIVPYEGIAFVSETPKRISWNNKRLHNEKEAAVEYSDGYKLYSLNGVTIEEELFKKIPEMTAEEVLSIENTEQRRVVYEIMDKSKMKELKDYKILDEIKDDDYGYKMKVIQFTIKGFDKPFNYLNCFCPSTGREYFLETESNNCLEAKSKSFGLDNIKFNNEF